MQVDEEMMEEVSNGNRHNLTPHNTACCNLSYRLENSTDSGFYSNTPSIPHSSTDFSDQSISKIETPLNSSKTPSSYFENRDDDDDRGIKKLRFSPQITPIFKQIDSSYKVSPAKKLNDSFATATIDDDDDNVFAETSSLYHDALDESNVQQTPWRSLKISSKSTPLSNSSLSPTKKKWTQPIQFKHRSLDESEFVDFLYYLGHKEAHTIVTSKLFAYLSDDDLDSVSQVSKTWRDVLLNDVKARKRLAAHRRIVRNTKENRSTTKSHKMREARKQGVEWSPFVDLQNIQIPASPSKARTQSTSSSPANARFEFFRKEGEKLDRNAKLVQCPRCMLPARCGQGGNYDNLGECQTPNCSFRFCTNCRSDFHSPRKCFRISSCPIKRKNMIIGSKASKRRLSRT